MAENRKWTREGKSGFDRIVNDGGKTLTVAKGTGILEQDGFAFKDLDKSGVMEPCKDWRLTAKERAKDLVSRMDLDSKLGLSLHDGMFTIMRMTEETLNSNPFLKAKFTLSGKNLEDAGNADPAELTDRYKEQVLKEKMRSWLVGAIDGPEYAARFNNNVQELAESDAYGIPVMISTNPRAFKDAHSDTAQRDVTTFPSNLGMAATFDPSLALEAAKVTSAEYRKMGISMELGPEADIASDPRWSRIGATFGSNPVLVADMIRAVCDGYQTTDGSEDGWGDESVVAMVKHWPGSTGEGGRESHSDAGKYAIFPNDRFDDHTYPWTDGAFKLNGPTKQCGSIMSAYDVQWDKGQSGAGQKGGSFNKYIIDGVLREQNDFEGFVCTDFWITGFINKANASRPFVNAWGLPDNTPAERALCEWESGVDQCGGTSEIEVLRGAYELAVERHGQEWADAKINEIAIRVLTPMFRAGIFENPYADPDEAEVFVGRSDHKKLAEDIFRKSLVLVKNKGILPLSGQKVYFAPKYKGGIPDRAGNIPPVILTEAFDKEEAAKVFSVVSSADEADAAVVLMDSPASGPGFSRKTGECLPISLQYNDYIAVNARAESISGDYHDGVKENRSYRGKSSITYNKYDLEVLAETKKQMGDKPVIVIFRCTNPPVPAEFEPLADAVLVIFEGTPDSIVFEMLSGRTEPSGLLPYGMPKDMDAVEAHYEDTWNDIESYTDSEGNAWGFGFGLNFSGRIRDARTEKYCPKKQA